MSGASTSTTTQSPPAIASINDVSALFQTAKKYEELNVIGTGAYGTVYKARDLHNGGQIVAMKKVKVALTEDGIPLSTLREIALLRQLEAYRHPNIVRLLDVCHGGQSVDRDHQLVLFLVFEHVEQDLESYLKKAPGPLSENRIRSMSYDILCGVDFLHSHRIVHRDLKPHNLLVTAAGRVKLADFGLAKTYDTEMKLTSVVVTLWYRPPEVLLGVSYNTAVDVWSCGCVLAQLHTRSPLLPGSSDSDQLHCIFRLIGRPPRQEWPDNVSVVADSFPPYPARDLADILPRAHPNAVNMIKGMLVFDPAKRLTALDCLEHPYFTEEPLT
ncbi:PREDICTED: cyclin-dependent kinase 4 [Papilio xuthus]|uniref:cyclin-dependent kinase n=1 Tax=Papilio xuthus TaxID=66420 RepID=A0A194PTM9_PAPXU|nr:PREDICTED: cyclin-dependent kinase 4 [Papilio xuthus]KPI96672.1 Cyclin-dependent kinase 6 [Papilio xuthus]